MQKRVQKLRNLPYELFVGLRYTRARKKISGGNRFISFISFTSMLGIALGCAALIVVLSVMNGFQQELRARILSVASHVQVSGVTRELVDWKLVMEQSRGDPTVVASAPYIDGQGMLSNGASVRGTLVRGILPEHEKNVAEIAEHMMAGKLEALKDGEFGIVLGSELARALGVVAGERVTLIAPQGLVTPAGMVPRLKQFRVVGIFEVGMFEYDSGLALIHLGDAQKLYSLGERVTGVRLKLTDLFQSRQVARSLLDRLDALPTNPNGRYFVTDWTRSHANFFRAVQIEKNVMFIILTLIVAVAAFNIVSTLVMAVTDKRADIAILRTLGASPGGIMRVFIVQGVLIGVIGTAIGVAGGVLLALNIGTVVPFLERMLGFQFLAKDIYYISELPSDLQRADVLMIAGMSLVLSLLATLYPSWRASRMNPAEALRYE